PAAAAPRHLQRVAGPRRRQDLHHERGWRDQRDQGGHAVPGPLGERVRRLHAQLAGGIRRPDLFPHHEIPVGDWHQTMKPIITAAVLTLAAARAPSVDPNWSRFRGPNGTGIAETTALPADFGPVTNVV